MRDLHHNIKTSVALNAAAISSSTTTNGAIIDTRGFDSVEFAILAGSLTDGTYTPSLTEGNESDLSDGSTVAADDMIGTVADATFASTDDNKVKSIGYRGYKRYVRLNIVSTSVTSGGTLGAVAIQGHAHERPTV